MTDNNLNFNSANAEERNRASEISSSDLLDIFPVPLYVDTHNPHFNGISTKAMAHLSQFFDHYADDMDNALKMGLERNYLIPDAQGVLQWTEAESGESAKTIC